jgi:hypothetical protein
MPTLPRRNSGPATGNRGPLRSSLADAAWAVEDRVVWGAADVLQDMVDAIREEVALWSRPVRAAALAGTIVLAAAGVAAGVIVSDPSGGDRPSAPEIVRVSAPGTPPPVATTPSAKAAEATGGAVLQGSTPDFAEEQGGGVTKAEAATEPPASHIAAGATDTPGVAAEATGAAGGGSEVAGPEAIAVAREFAGAFVLYETGHDTAAVKTVFHQTAIPDLAKALLARPPRLPANVKVPEAKVLNVVAGPKHGDTYTVSVSLLRVGVTSELRLDMQKMQTGGGASTETNPDSSKQSEWLVTDVLG